MRQYSNQINKNNAVAEKFKFCGQFPDISHYAILFNHTFGRQDNN